MADDGVTVTFRLAAWQRRRVVLQTLGLVAAATGLTVARVLLPESGLPLGPSAVGAWTVVAVSLWTVPLLLGGSTRCSPAGLRASTFSGDVEVTWREITAMEVRTSFLSRTQRLVLTTTAGRRVALVAPISGRGVRSEDFEREVLTIADLWDRATSSDG